MTSRSPWPMSNERLRPPDLGRRRNGRGVADADDRDRRVHDGAWRNGRCARRPSPRPCGTSCSRSSRSGTRSACRALGALRRRSGSGRGSSDPSRHHDVSRGSGSVPLVHRDDALVPFDPRRPRRRRRGRLRSATQERRRATMSSRGDPFQRSERPVDVRSVLGPEQRALPEHVFVAWVRSSLGRDGSAPLLTSVPGRTRLSRRVATRSQTARCATSEMSGSVARTATFPHPPNMSGSVATAADSSHVAYEQ